MCNMHTGGNRGVEHCKYSLRFCNQSFNNIYVYTYTVLYVNSFTLWHLAPIALNLFKSIYVITSIIDWYGDSFYIFFVRRNLAGNYDLSNAYVLEENDFCLVNGSQILSFLIDYKG